MYINRSVLLMKLYCKKVYICCNIGGQSELALHERGRNEKLKISKRSA